MLHLENKGGLLGTCVRTNKFDTSWFLTSPAADTEYIFLHHFIN